MKNYAIATYKIVKMGVLAEAILEVDSSNGWLGACVVSAPVSRLGELEKMCYEEADRRAQQAGVRLERLTQISTSNF